MRVERGVRRDDGKGGPGSRRDCGLVGEVGGGLSRLERGKMPL